MIGPLVTSWLARWTPALAPTHGLHHAALRAGLKGEYPAAERLFARASARYAEEYEPEDMLRLHAQRRLFRKLATALAGTPTGA